MKKISTIFGAGFSFYAGLPLVKDISEKFKAAPLEDKIVRQFSGEWQWVEYIPSELIHSGHSNSSYIVFGKCLDILIRKYLKMQGTTFLNYEDFYEWLVDLNKTKGSEYDEFKSELNRWFNTIPPSRYFYNTSITLSDIIESFLYLIDHLLIIRKPVQELQQAYQAYIKIFCQPNVQLDIFTLNHDILIETLLDKLNIPYSNGFSNEDSCFYGETDDMPIAIFCNRFNSKINIYKLHGGLYQFKYQFLGEEFQPVEYEYFYTKNYYDKHKIFYKEGTILKKHPQNVVPQLVTGKNKLDLIQNDKMYKVLYDEFKTKLPQSDKLLIVGYSFQDDHINTVIKESLEYIPEVVNINPNDKFPFEHPNVTNIDPRNGVTNDSLS